ncbi:GNAT family N-acetyltransferase [[Mycobacterium] crassicus]|uniref:GNAT family N-acetyltransferase n=1 Tax=[Mycobacterium] crassicus TaxID=2872309 RepID=A0ABU5XET5_9MYCO|nr:GNAT family N-acetyltransferase [Mycolicibacter sp. MYC098]MEB3019847.1 GNAT family N-acetyltransferase [Mycolicibacter sp. MYC098]
MSNPDGVEFSADGARVDRDWLWNELVAQTYWAKYRTRAMFDRQLDHAWRVVGAYRADDGAMIGFCRAFSDGAAMAYLADVYVARSERGREIGKGLLRAMIDEGPGRDFRWMLHTGDAHGLYEQFDFAVPDATFMERRPRLPHVRD